MQGRQAPSLAYIAPMQLVQKEVLVGMQVMQPYPHGVQLD